MERELTFFEMELLRSRSALAPLEVWCRVVQVLKAKYLTSPIHYEGMKRREPLEVPEDALREILYNAIAHKDYMGAPIQMRVWDDYVEIWNKGGLPLEKHLTELTLQDMLINGQGTLLMNPMGWFITDTFLLMDPTISNVKIDLGRLQGLLSTKRGPPL